MVNKGLGRGPSPAPLARLSADEVVRRVQVPAYVLDDGAGGAELIERGDHRKHDLDRAMDRRPQNGKRQLRPPDRERQPRRPEIYQEQSQRECDADDMRQEGKKLPGIAVLARWADG